MLKRNKRRPPRIFFATDVHGSETCFRKFVNAAKAYSADAIILGGDITGKQLVVIVAENGGWRIGSQGGETIGSREALDAAIRSFSAGGLYPIVVTPDEERALADTPVAVEKRFTKERLGRVRSWMELAEERLRPQGIPCYVSPGNDDDREVAQVVDDADWVENPEGRVVEVSGHEMISWGWSNHTPWDTPREQSEEDLGKDLERMASKLREPEAAIFNLHCPPYRSGLDEAPDLDETLKPITRGGQLELKPVGSTAVRDSIERYQPMVGLHGHIHDCRAMRSIGRSMCINPGSDYQTATLRGALIVLGPREVTAWSFTTG